MEHFSLIILKWDTFRYSLMTLLKSSHAFADDWQMHQSSPHCQCTCWHRLGDSDKIHLSLAPSGSGLHYYDIWFCGSWGSRLDPPPWFMIVVAPHNRVFHSIYYTVLLLIKLSSFCSTTLTYPLTTSLHGPYPSQYCPPPTAPTFINCTIFSYPAYLVSIIYSHKRPCPFLCLSESHARKSTGTL